MTTTTYTDYPFISYGVKFISRVFDNSPMANQIAMLPEGVFAQINFEALTELVGDASLFTRDELLAELERVNEGGTHSFILLDEENN
jgi:hypothetical protein